MSRPVPLRFGGCGAVVGDKNKTCMISILEEEEEEEEEETRFDYIRKLMSWNLR